MTPKRIRSLNVSVGLMTALSLGVASLAGCSSFDPNPAATGQAPVTPTSTAAPAAPAGGTTTTAAPVALTNLTGSAVAGGKPLANATVTVVNAFTGKPLAGLVAAGAGNLVAAGAGNLVAAGAGNLVAAGAGNYGLAQASTLKTDANGNYDLNIPEMKGSDMVRIIVTTADGAQLTTLAGGNVNATAYEIKQVGSIKKSYKLKIDVASTLATNAMSGVLKLLAGMKDGDREKAINGFVEDVQKAEGKFQEKLDANPDAEAKLLDGLVKSAQKDPGSINSDAAQDAGLLAFKEIAAILEAAGVDSTDPEFTNLVADTLKDILTIASDGDGIAPGETLVISTNDFPPTINVDLTKIAEGEVTFTDPVTNEPVVVDVEVEDVQVDEEIDALDDVANNTSFVPSVTIHYNATDTDSPLELKVSQADGNFDVEKIVAKIPTTYVASTNLAQTSGTVVNSTAETELSGGWLSFGAADTHKIYTDAGSTASQYNGTWKVGTTTVADVTVTKDSGYTTATFEFAMTGNDALETVGGTIKLEALASLIKLNVTELKKQDGINQPVTIEIYSRSSSDIVATDTAQSEVKNIYYRSIGLTQ